MNESLHQAPTQTRRSSLTAVVGAAAIASVLPLAGCVSRATPFKELGNDKTLSVSVLKLAPAPAPQTMPTPMPTTGLPFPIPPEIAAMGQAACSNPQFAALLGPLCQGAGGSTMPNQPQPRLFRNTWMVGDERPIQDRKMIDDLLDIFGDDGSFNGNRQQCFNPGMAVSFVSPTRPEPVDVVLSFQCNQAVGYGFQWPHPQSGFTNETRTKLNNVYRAIFGTDVPPGG